MTPLPLALALALAAPAPPAPETFRGDGFGAVTVLHPPASPARVVLYLASGDGAAPSVLPTLQALAADGALVLSIATPRWAERLRRERCAYPAGELESLAQGFQKRAAMPVYLRPILVGEGLGVAVASAAEAQAPAGTFLGAVAFGGRSEPRPPIAFCRGSAADRTRAPQEPQVAAGDLAALRQAVRALDPVAPPPAPRAPTSGPAVADLPLVEVTTAAPGDAFAVLVTGDGGWAGIDRELAAALSAKGLPVVGLDSLKYFWDRRTPEALAADLGRIVEHYAAAWGRSEVALVGYSRGADVIPAAATQLAAGPRGRVRAIALLGPGRAAEFELHLTDFLTSSSDGRPILPDVDQLGATPIVCLYGREETDESLCPLLRARANVTVVELAGAHHFGGDYGAVAREVVRALAAPAAAR